MIFANKPAAFSDVLATGDYELTPPQAIVRSGHHATGICSKHVRSLYASQMWERNKWFSIVWYDKLQVFRISGDHKRVVLQEQHCSQIGVFDKSNPIFSQYIVTLHEIRYSL